MTKIFAAAFLALTLGATMSFANPGGGYHDGGHHDGGHHEGGHHPNPHPGPHHPGDEGDAFSIGVLLGLTSADITTDANNYPEYKMAIVQGEDAALEVLQGGDASDLFLNAKSATEQLYNIEFGSEIEAAIAVLQLNQIFSEQ